MADKEAYIAKAKARMDQWNADIDKLQAKAAEAEADARIQYEDQLAELRKQRDEAEARMKELASASDDAWQDLKAGFDATWDNMTGAFEKAMSRFR
ncbi:MAG: sll1863 family stress response protein [Erythrobacter sp.]